MTAFGMAASWDGCFWDNCFLGWLLLSIFADFEQVKKISSYFADFGQVKKTNSKSPVGETGCLCIFCLGVAFFFECIGIQFFNSLTCDS